MKTAILYFMALALFMGCSSDESEPQNNDLVGDWKLMSFVNEANGTILTKDDFESSNEITTTFNEDFNYEGSTVRNEFFGNYTLNDSKTVLTLIDVFGTEVGETDWGNLFYDNLSLNYNPSTNNYENDYFLLDDVLKIYYAEKEYMEFMKIEP